MASAPDDGTDFAALLEAADTALARDVEDGQPPATAPPVLRHAA